MFYRIVILNLLEKLWIGFQTTLKRREVLWFSVVKNPQTNGKLERLWHEYDKHRWRFRSLKEWIDWYNDRLHGAVKNHQSKTGGMIMPHFVWFLSTTKTKLFLCRQKFSIFEVLRIPRVIQITRYRRVEF